ncbi:vacuolar protein 14 C-terminal Fig4p binding-domain-containing protein [Irpex lacteus]|nr:vacuolar protein 14 C-terminal Fig4p binding-domain-containing protein [Irpex lacteus]
METSISKQLVDKMYEKRKAAALELEKQIRECHQQGDHRRIAQIVDQLVDMFSNPQNPLQARNGGLDIAPYMEKFITPLLVCFTDPENRILVYFNEIFDALSKLAADSELSVKNGAELLDRLLKDIVAETASVYVPQYPETEKARRRADEKPAFTPAGWEDLQRARKAFSLAHFIPLLKERIYALNPFTRSFLVTWITKYLSDPTEDVRIATENLLADFLREIRDVTLVQRHHEDQLKAKRAIEAETAARGADGDKEKLPDITMSIDDTSTTPPDEKEGDIDERDLGGRCKMTSAIVEILIQQLDDQDLSSPTIRVPPAKILIDSVSGAPSVAPGSPSNGTVHSDNLTAWYRRTRTNSPPHSHPRNASGSRPRPSTAQTDDSPASAMSAPPQLQQSPEASMVQEKDRDLFDYQSTVNAEHEETRVAALKWLIMLHQKAPRRFWRWTMDLPALLKTLSDSSEEVIKHDLQLLAQISSSSEESYFKLFMINLLELFSTDRKLLETRGSLIIRHGMVMKLNMILITSPELAEFRRRLKSLETRQDGQALFTTLYRSWCHNAVAAYEHASNLLYIFADLEVTVQLLVQIDKLSAFVSLRNRLSAVNSQDSCTSPQIVRPPCSSSTLASLPKYPNNHIQEHLKRLNTRSKLGREDIKWSNSSPTSATSKTDTRNLADRVPPGISYPCRLLLLSNPNSNPNDKPPAVRRRVTGTSTSRTTAVSGVVAFEPRARVLGHGGAGGGRGCRRRRDRGRADGVGACVDDGGGPASPTFVQIVSRKT